MRVTFLSNGYGEDVVGALLAEAMRRAVPDAQLQAFPTVGRGRAYEKLGLPILGPRLELPSGGLTAHTPAALWADLRAGFLPLTAAQLRALRGLETDLLIVVGDIYALLLSAQVRLVARPQRFYVQTLVSAWQRPVQDSSPMRRTLGQVVALNRYFMERFSLPERVLMRRLVAHTYVRDEATAGLLRGYGLSVSALGNPMLDALHPTEASAQVLGELPLTAPVVALLPGTRSYREAALTTMLAALALLPGATGLIAWTGETPPALAGWRWQPAGRGCWSGLGPPGQVARVYLLQGHFAEVLRAADLALGTAGTANEQAAALGRPVVSFPLPPLYSHAFLANQQRLLGAALTLCERDPGALAAALAALWRDTARYERAAQTGKARMGAAGGSAAIVRAILFERSGPTRSH